MTYHAEKARVFINNAERDMEAARMADRPERQDLVAAAKVWASLACAASSLSAIEAVS